MAEVFEGTVLGAQGFARPVAIKRMLPLLSADPAFGKMFINEARLAALLHHPNIVAIHDFDRDESGSYFLVMELVQGVDLRRLLTSGRLPHSVSATIVAEVLRGLGHAHEMERDGRRLGLVHRDVSPHNVMVSWEGAVKLVDFGIAKAVAATGASQSGSLKGKMGYMSPEQAHGLELDGRSDLFAVGVMLHEMLTGVRLFAGATEPEVLARLLTQPIPRPAELDPVVPSDLDALAMGLLERDRERRFPSALAALESLLAGTSVTARGSLELQELLAERFPHAPRRRGDSGSALLGQGTPQEPAAMAAGSAVTSEPAAAAGATVTASAQAGMPSAPAGEPAVAGRQGARRIGPALWIAGVGVVLAASAVVWVALR